MQIFAIKDKLGVHADAEVSGVIAYIKEQSTFKGQKKQMVVIKDGTRKDLDEIWVEVKNRAPIAVSEKGQLLQINGKIQVVMGDRGVRLVVDREAKIHVGEKPVAEDSTPAKTGYKSGGGSYSGRREPVLMDQDTFEEHVRRARHIASSIIREDAKQHGGQVTPEAIQAFTATIIIAAKDHGVTLKILDDQAAL